MKRLQLVWSVLASISLGCSSTDFSSEEGRRREPEAGRQSELPRDDDAIPDDQDPDASDASDPDIVGDDDGTDDGMDDGEDEDTLPEDPGSDDLDVDDDMVPGKTKPEIDYAGCARLPAGGKRPYGQCNPNEVVVIVNDGETPQMTCCPVDGGDLFDKDPAKLFQLRFGTCAAGEILSGMVEPHTPTLLCSALASDLKTATVQSSVLAHDKMALSTEIKSIVAQYHGTDTCLCPQGTMAIGGHTDQDNSCGEKCVTLELK